MHLQTRLQPRGPRLRPTDAASTWHRPPALPALRTHRPCPALCRAAPPRRLNAWIQQHSDDARSAQLAKPAIIKEFGMAVGAAGGQASACRGACCLVVTMLRGLEGSLPAAYVAVGCSWCCPEVHAAVAVRPCTLNHPTACARPLVHLCSRRRSSPESPQPPRLLPVPPPTRPAPPAAIHQRRA